MTKQGRLHITVRPGDSIRIGHATLHVTKPHAGRQFRLTIEAPQEIAIEHGRSFVRKADKP